MKNVIDKARYFMRCRRFSEAIAVLNSKREIYESSFDFFYTLGLAFLYAGDTGSAATNFGKAREIKMSDENLLFAQAAIFLRRGETDRAVEYYLDILDLNPLNKDAKRALTFVREHGDYEEICRCIDNGTIENYYPQLGTNPLHIRNIILCLCFGAACGFLLVRFLPRNHFNSKTRGDISSLALSVDSKIVEDDSGGGNYKYTLSEKEIKDSYNKAAGYLGQYRDNAAQRELNRILNSNATSTVKQKCREMMKFFSVPDFTNLKDNFTYEEVEKEPELYLGCYVDWSGRVSNPNQGKNSYTCNLMIGYEDKKSLDGVVKVRLDFRPVPEIDTERPVRFLGKLSSDSGKLLLEGISVSQSIKDAYN